MKILTKEELEEIEILGRGSGIKNNKQVFELLKKLSVGEAILLPKEEWSGKTAPNVSIAGTFRANRGTKRFSILQAADKKSWVITRKV